MGYWQFEISGAGNAPGGGEYTTTEMIRGVDYALLQTGFDLKFGRVVGVGPFASLSLGQDFACTYEELGHREHCPTGNLHGWLTLGLRVTFEL